MRSAVVLAGGEGRRIGGDKPLVSLGGSALLDRTVAALDGVVDEIVVVARDGAQAKVLGAVVPGVRLCWDDRMGLGPVAGLLAGMGYAGGEYAFACGCDHPFLNPGVIDELFELAAGRDGAVPVFRGYAERLHAVYRTGRMAEACGKSLSEVSRGRGGTKISGPLSRMDVNYVDVGVIRSPDPGHLTFFNVNTPEDLLAAKEILRRRSVPGGGEPGLKQQ